MKKNASKIIVLSVMLFLISLFMPFGPKKSESGRPLQPIIGILVVFKTALIPIHSFQEYSVFKNEPNMIPGFLGEVIIDSLIGILASLANLMLVSTFFLLYSNSKGGARLGTLYIILISIGFFCACYILFRSYRVDSFFIGTYFWLASFLANIFGLVLYIKGNRGRGA